MDLGTAEWRKRSALTPTFHPRTPRRYQLVRARDAQACQFPDFCTQPCCALYRLVTADASPTKPLQDPFEAPLAAPKHSAKRILPDFIRRPNCGCGTDSPPHGPCCVLSYRDLRRQARGIEVSPTPAGDPDQRVRRIQAAVDEDKDQWEMDAQEEERALQRVRETNATMAALLAQLRAAEYNK